MWPRSLRRPGRRVRPERLLLPALLALALGACNYGFRGGGGFPSHIRSLYIAPLEVGDDVSRVDLRQELYNLLLEEVPRALGVRSAGEEAAGAVLRVRILRYDDVAQNYRSNETGGAIQVLENQVEIAVQAELIDVQQNLILWDNRSLLGRGGYLPDQQTEREGQIQAMDNIVQLIIDGAQSQW